MSSGIIIFEPAQEPVSDAGHRLRELLQSAAEAILELDSQGRIVLLNRMAEQLFGYTPGELLGQTSRKVLFDKVQEVNDERPCKAAQENGR